MTFRSVSSHMRRLRRPQAAGRLGTARRARHIAPVRVANALGWLGIAAIIVVALVVANLLGFLGLFLIGGLGWLVCTRAALSNDVPTWSAPSFAAHLEQRSPEQQAAEAAQRQSSLLPLRSYGPCAMVLTAIGAAGFAWQTWSAASP